MTKPFPAALEGAVFDLDGVVTRTAGVHARAWKQLFDAYLRRRAEATGDPFVPFDIDADYRGHVDGRPRYEGVAAFLASRGIELPRGDPDDPPGAETICGLGNDKNRHFRAQVAEQGVEVFDGAVRFIDALRARGVVCCMVSSSKNCRLILDTVGLTDRFAVIIDGATAAERGLPGKPAPDTFVAAARDAGLEPGQCAVFEDALVGVAAGRAGGFALVVGVDQGTGPDALRAHGADEVVNDLGEFDVRA